MTKQELRGWIEATDRSIDNWLAKKWQGSGYKAQYDSCPLCRRAGLEWMTYSGAHCGKCVWPKTHDRKWTRCISAIRKCRHRHSVEPMIRALWAIRKRLVKELEG